MNRLVAFALLFLTEEDAFWCLVAIVDYHLPQEYFGRSMEAAQTDQVQNCCYVCLYETCFMKFHMTYAKYCKTRNVCVFLFFTCSQKLSSKYFPARLIVYTLIARNAKRYFHKICVTGKNVKVVCAHKYFLFYSSRNYKF